MDKLIVKKHSQVPHDIFSYYGLDDFLSEEIERERTEISKKIIQDGLFSGGAISNISNAFELKVVIPEEFVAGLRSGDLHLGDSTKMVGQKSPGVYNSDNKLIGQLRIKDTVDIGALATSLTNIAMYATLSSISSQIMKLDEKVETLLEENEIMRKSEVIGSIKTFTDGWPYKKPIEMRNCAEHAIRDINKQIANEQQLIKKYKDKLERKGLGFWKGFLKGLSSKLFKYDSDLENKKNYASMMKSLGLYCKYMKYKDILQVLRGEDSNHIANNHFSDVKFIKGELENTPKIIEKRIGKEQADVLEEVKILFVSMPEKIKNSNKNAIEISYSPKELYKNE